MLAGLGIVTLLDIGGGKAEMVLGQLGVGGEAFLILGDGLIGLPGLERRLSLVPELLRRCRRTLFGQARLAANAAKAGKPGEAHTRTSARGRRGAARAVR